MKYLIVLLCLSLSGCVGTIVVIKPEPPEIKVYRCAIFYKVDIPRINKDGIQGYSGKNDTEAIQAITDGVVNAAIKGAK